MCALPYLDALDEIEGATFLAPPLWLLMSPQPSTSTGLWTHQASWAAGEPHGRGVPPPIGAVLLPDLSKSGRCPIDYPCIDADDYSPNQPSDHGLRSSVEEARGDLVKRPSWGVDDFVERPA